jgi:hypothetical protein
MRVGYLVMGLGLAVVKWPLLLHASSLPLFEGVVTCLFTALSLLAILGLRYPIRLLPVLLFETVWKLIWLAAVALPAVLAGDVDDATAEVIFNCSLVVIILAVRLGLRRAAPRTPSTSTRSTSSVSPMT